MSSDIIGIGHNKAPLTELLGESHRTLGAEAEEILASANRAPPTVTDDTIAGKFGDLIKLIIGISSRAEKSRKAEKEPFLQAGKDVDAFFAQFINPLDAAKKSLLARQGTYLAQKEAEERRRREEVARIAQQEEARKLREAQAAEEAGRTAEADTALLEAAEAETRGNLATKAADASVADLARTHSAWGSTSSLQSVWEFVIEDRARIPLDQIRAFIPQDAIEKAIRAAVKTGIREIPGVRIFETRKAIVR